MGYIYTITNKTDNKTYVGQTIRDLEARWRDHLKKRSNCRYLSSALKKYGIDNFVFKLVCITFDNLLDDMEIKYIEKYNIVVNYQYGSHKKRKLMLKKVNNCSYKYKSISCFN